ncbi:MAG: tRNA (guanosine(46)-N7)-methyltransferase TrmB [Pseudomonadales bacterium]|nr:tRNA (guanosine(46)-N7)-methyltransferase TrmB [Pseudomonadales bacterium]
MPDRLRGIKSFVLRQGRLTTGQTRALKLHWPKFGRAIDDGMLNPRTQFSDAAPLHLEIGFGMGDSLAEQARSNPSVNYVGIEVHRPGVGHILMLIDDYELDNLRLYSEDSIDVLREVIPAKSLDAVQVFFPDPWPKKKHHKRRILNRNFVDLVETKLNANGLVHIATDWQPYAEEIESLFGSITQFNRVAAPLRPQTKFERRGMKLGHTIFDLAYRLVD